MNALLKNDINQQQVRLQHRIVCEAFAFKMAGQLDKHIHIGNFMEWTPTQMEMFMKLRKAVADLEIANMNCDRERVSDISADIGNIAMRFSQLYGV